MFKGWGLTAVLIAAAGAWLGWAMGPVMVGYRAGLEIGRMQGARQAAARGGEPLPPERP
jgi:hypothetical protein